MLEIERKFIVDKEKLPSLSAGKEIKQAYVAHGGNKEIRARIKDSTAYVTIKVGDPGLVREEYEYEVNMEFAEHLIYECSNGNLIDKTRYEVEFKGKTWEIDFFKGNLNGLVLAEVELDSEDEVIELPEWVSDEVTGQAEFTNYYLSQG